MLGRIASTIKDRFFNTRTQTVTAGAIMLGATFLASRLLGLIRSRLLVSAFGIGGTLDAYFAAFQVPDFAYNLLISATLGVSFIPVFCEYLVKDKQEAWRIANSVLNLIMAIMGALCLIFFAFAPEFVHLVSPGFSGRTYDMTVALTRILLLSPWLFSVSAIFSSILNAFRSFLLVSLAPLLYNVAIILGILFLAPRWGIYGVAISVIAGAGLHILIQIPGAKKFGFSWQPRIDLANKGVREILKLIVPRILALDLSQVSGLLGTIIASALAAGSVALFNLMYSLEAVPVAIFAVSFVVSVFPSLSSAVAQGNVKNFKNDFSYTVRQILFFLVPITVLTFVFRTQVVNLLIGIKSLSQSDVQLGAATLAIFAFSFVFQGIAPLLARGFFAFKNTVVPLVISLVSLAIDVGATYGFLAALRTENWFSQGIISIMHLNAVTDVRVLALSLGFSATSLFNMVVLAALLRRKVGRFDGTRIGIAFLKDLAAGAAGGYVGWLTLGMIKPLVNVERFSGIAMQLGGALLAAGAAAAIVFVMLRSEEMNELLSSIGKRFTGTVPEEIDVP